MASGIKNIEEVGQVGATKPSQLITPVIRSYVKKGFKIGQYCYMHPFVWNSGNRNSVLTHVSTRTGTGTGAISGLLLKWRLYVWYLNIVYTFAYAAFVVVRCYQTYQDVTRTQGMKIYMQFVAVYFMFPCGLQMAFYCHGSEFPAFIEGFLEFTEHFEKEYLAKTGVQRRGKILIRICEFVMTNVYRSFNSVSVLMVIGSYLRPDSPEHLTSLLEDPRSLSFVQKLPFMILFGYFEVMFHSLCFIQLFPNVAFVLPALVCLKELGRSVTVEVTRESAVNLDRQFQTYHALGLLVQGFNRISSQQALSVVKVCLILFVIVGTYCGVQLEGLPALTLGFLAFYSFLLLILVFWLLSEFHTRSSAVLEVWKQIVYRAGIKGNTRSYNDYKNYVYCKKVLKSLLPMKVTVQKYYYVDKEMLKTMIRSVVDQTISFLIANR